MVAGLAFAGCEISFRDPGALQTAFDQEPFIQQRLDEAWITVPGARMVLGRAVGPVAEQRILLPNKTSLRGDNIVLLKIHGTSLNTAGRFLPVKFLKSQDADLFPFTDIEGLTFFSKTDDLGTLNWAEWSNDAGLTCVLALRRLDSGSRVIPGKRSAMDMVVRNCIHGTAEDALTPARATQVGFAAPQGRPGGAPDMLSPLAGPLP